MKKRFKNMKISKKLIASFLAVVILAIAVGFVGLYSLSAANERSRMMYNQDTVTIEKLSNIAQLYQRTRVILSSIIMIKDPEKQQAKIDDLAARSEAMNTVIAELDPLLDGEAKDMLEDIKSTLATYKPLQDEVVDIAKTGDSSAAYAQMTGTETFDVAMSVQDKISALEQKMLDNAAQKYQSSQNEAAISQWIIIGVLAVAVIISVFLVFLLTRSVTKPIKATSKQLKYMGEGALFEPLDTSKFSGEFYQMAVDMNNVRSALYGMLGDAGMLADAAAKGNLSMRADLEKHKGGYREIIQGINNTLDSVILPVQEASAVLKEMEKGNLNISVTGEYLGDHAIIKNSLNSFLSKLWAIIGEIDETLEEISRGNLDLDIKGEYSGNFATLKKSINGIVASLNDTMREINTAATQVASGTTQVSAGSQTLSQGATEQASSIEELSASITQIAAQTKQNATNANTANGLALSAQTDAASGNGQMKEMQDAMAQINESSQNISKIIKVIDDIAFQTNILALNAAVEAARAGVHGKGFAVVAEEVRNLAARSAEAAKETTELIEGSIRKVEAGTKIADHTASALSSIVTGVEKAAELIGQIASASNEQATAISQVNRGIEQLSQVVQTNSATAEEAAAASEELSSQADLLKTMVAQFRLQDTESIKLNAPKKAPALKEVKGGIELSLSDEDYGKY